MLRNYPDSADIIHLFSLIILDIINSTSYYRGADKSLARPGRKQVNVSVRMACISFRALPCRTNKT